MLKMYQVICPYFWRITDCSQYACSINRELRLIDDARTFPCSLFQFSKCIRCISILSNIYESREQSLTTLLRFLRDTEEKAQTERNTSKNFFL